MAKVTAKLRVGNAVIEGQGETQKELFENLADTAAIFTVTRCGMCQSQAIAPEHRITGEGGKFHYYSWRCVDCGGELHLGQKMDGVTLYLKTKEPANTRGWSKYQANRGGDPGASDAPGWDQP